MIVDFLKVLLLGLILQEIITFLAKIYTLAKTQVQTKR